MLTHEIMYQAILAKDVSFEGTFITAVKTTGIFCRPTCTARKPKIENVEFLKTTHEAILKGYRPCKVCLPMQKIGETPSFITEILKALNDDPSQKLKDADLINKGVEPSAIRRWFLKEHGMTFQAYQRLFRINLAFKKLQQGQSVTSTAFEAGFESLSGFADSFKSIYGVSPSNGIYKQIIYMTRLETPLGTMIACAVEEGVCLLEFTDRKMLETELKTLARTLNADIIQSNHAHFDTLIQQLNEYFAGNRKEFTVPLFTPGSLFQQAVWGTLRAIPYGAIQSYKQQAISIKRPTAIRAVANANGMNRISILIPCHRVIGENGLLTGYGGGIWRKKQLLELEKCEFTNAGVPSLF